MKRKPTLQCVAAAAAAAFVSTLSLAQDETLVSGPGAGLTQQKCQICHELGHVTRSRLSRGEWAENLKTMRERGAPLSDDEVGIILDYLSAYYGRGPAPAPAPDTRAPGGQDPIARLLAEHACTGCHDVSRTIVGPAFREVALKYAGDAGAPARIAEKIRAGGAGTWGKVPMPGNTALSDSDIRRLAEWVLGQK